MKKIPRKRKPTKGDFPKGHTPWNKTKQFCSNGHDTFVVGRRKNGNCIKCQQDRINLLSQLRKSKPKIKNTFCSKGHNKDIVGITKGGACVECKRDYDQEHYIPHPKVKVNTTICKHGHDTSICGRNSDNACKDCAKISYLKRQKNGKNTDYYLRKLYGISKADFASMFEKQKGLCLGCKKNHVDLKKGLCVDHDHITGKVRGLLCSDCNTILGMAKDSVEVLQVLANYLIASKKI